MKKAEGSGEDPITETGPAPPAEKEELAMVKRLNQNAGIAQAVEVLEKLGMSRSLGWYWAQSQKARRDRAAEDMYVRAEGQEFKLVTQVCRKLRKGKDTETIAGELEEDIAESRLICEAAENFSPGYDEKKVFAKLMEKKR